MDKEICCHIPLPVSKNRKWARKTYYSRRAGKVVNTPVLSRECLLLRRRIGQIIRATLAGKNVKFAPRRKTILGCSWVLPDKNRDVVNFHDELADIVKKAIGVDDRYFMIRDMDIEWDSSRVGVVLCIKQVE